MSALGSSFVIDQRPRRGKRFGLRVIYAVADELRQISDMGLTYSQDAYDRERFTRIGVLSARLAASEDGAPTREIVVDYSRGYAHLSPLIGADAVVIEQGKVLLIRRRDNGLWALPGGLAEVGESVPRAAERELFEEAGIDGTAVRLLGAWDSRSIGSSPRMQMLHVAFLVQAKGDARPAGDGLETFEARYFGADELPALSPGHNVMVPHVLKAACDPTMPAWFDR